MTSSPFGLTAGVVEKLHAVFANHPEIKTVLIYGSRALGTQRLSSDIDLTIKDDLDLTELLKVENELDDLLLPYKIDLSVFAKIDSKSLIDHISRVAKPFYIASGT